MFSIVTSSAEETQGVGELLGALLDAGSVVCLYGDLGSGKTNFSFGVARGLKVQAQYITSPTFTLVNEYPGRIPFYHIDLYRLRGASELEGIGFHEYLESAGATVIEWADRAEGELPPERLSVYFSDMTPSSRDLGFLAEGERYEKVLGMLKQKIEARSIA